MIQVEELADELVDGVARFHLHVHGQEEGEEKLEKGKSQVEVEFKQSSQIIRIWFSGVDDACQQNFAQDQLFRWGKASLMHTVDSFRPRLS